MRARILVAMLATLTLAGCSSTVEPTVPDAAEPTTIPVARPIGLDVPALDLHVSQLVNLGLDDDAHMEVPRDATSTGWFVPGPAPGEVGPAILAAHVNYDGVPGPFARLHELKAGDEVTVHRADNSDAVFVIDKVDQFPKADFPTETIYGNVTRPELRLITCGGRLDTTTHSYDDNIVASAHLSS